MTMSMSMSMTRLLLLASLVSLNLGKEIAASDIPQEYLSLRGNNQMIAERVANAVAITTRKDADSRSRMPGVKELHKFAKKSGCAAKEMQMEISNRDNHM